MKFGKFDGEEDAELNWLISFEKPIWLQCAGLFRWSDIIWLLLAKWSGLLKTSNGTWLGVCKLVIIWCSSVICAGQPCYVYYGREIGDQPSLCQVLHYKKSWPLTSIYQIYLKNLQPDSRFNIAFNMGRFWHFRLLLPRYIMFGYAIQSSTNSLSWWCNAIFYSERSSPRKAWQA